MAGWLLIGLGAGALNALLLSWSVWRLQPRPGSLGALRLWLGAALRWLLALLLLSAALRRGILPGLLAFAGMWLSRSLFVAWLGLGGWPWNKFSPE